MNRNHVRLFVAVILAWLVGALGGLAIVPYSAFVFVFCGVLVVVLVVAFWDGRSRDDQESSASLSSSGRSRRRLGLRARDLPPRDLSIVLERYRLGWLAAALVLGTVVGWLNMFMFAPAVLQVTGTPVHAHRVGLSVTDRLSDPGSDVECILARPDGTRIPGALPIPDEDVCHDNEDVVVDSLGVVDPVRATDSLDGAIVVEVVLVGLSLGLCVPAARPRHNEP